MKPKIIVVEDEFIIALDIKGILSNEGYDVIINIDSVEKAIKAIDEENPSIVLIDINLANNKDGVDLGKYLLLKDVVPYIYITSNVDKLTIDRVKETRPYGYIVKPFKPADITTTVALVLNNYKHKNIDTVRLENPHIDDTPFRIKETINYINDNIFEKIELADLVNLTKWKQHHFIRVFTKHLGVTPYQYILSRKIERAKSMLLDDTISISEIAFELGFQSYSNFCLAFKKMNENQTPEDYKKHNITNKRLEKK